MRFINSFTFFPLLLGIGCSFAILHHQWHHSVSTLSLVTWQSQWNSDNSFFERPYSAQSEKTCAVFLSMPDPPRLPYADKVDAAMFIEQCDILTTVSKQQWNKKEVWLITNSDSFFLLSIRDCLLICWSMERIRSLLSSSKLDTCGYSEAIHLATLDLYLLSSCFL